jgi:hypothetical protein
MVKIALTAAVILAAVCGRCEAFDWRFSEADISALKSTSDFLRVLGMPGEIAVTGDSASSRTRATLRYTYYFVVGDGVIRPVDYFFVDNRLVRRGKLSADQSRRYRLLAPDLPGDTDRILRYKRSVGTKPSNQAMERTADRRALHF